MTSVPSPLQQSNGNRMRSRSALYFLVVTLCAITIGCKSTRKSTMDTQIVNTNPVSEMENKSKSIKSDVDTVYWTEIDRTVEYNQKIEDLELDKRASYDVSFLFPFSVDNTDIENVIDPSTALGRISHFYAGTKLALEKLDEDGVQLNVTVIDSESGSFDNKLQKCRHADLIIGPRQKGQLATTAQYGKSNGLPVVSPWLSSSKITQENPYYIQLKPSLKDHFSHIIDHVTDNYSNDQVIVLGRNIKKDRAMMYYLQKLGKAKSGSDSKPFGEFYIEEDSLINGEVAFDSIFLKERETVFILPNWSFSDDEKFVYNTVRKLGGEKGMEKVVLYGMPILLESKRIKFENYSNLNMRVCRSSFLDRDSPAVKEFRQKYFQLYNDFPSEEVYNGFDTMLFLGRSLFNYGKKFQYFLDTYNSSLLLTEFDIQKVFKGNSDKFSDIEYFQNKHLYLLSFENNRFVIAE